MFTFPMNTSPFFLPLPFSLPHCSPLTLVHPITLWSSPNRNEGTIRAVSHGLAALMGQARLRLALVVKTLKLPFQAQTAVSTISLVLTVSTHLNKNPTAVCIRRGQPIMGLPGSITRFFGRPDRWHPALTTITIHHFITLTSS